VRTYGRLSLTLALLLTWVGFACTAGDSDGEHDTTRTVLPDVTLATCTGPRTSGEPVSITLAHTERRVRKSTLEALVAEFDRLHPDIDVTVAEGDHYEGIVDDWADPGTRPHLALLPQHQTRRMVDSGQTVEPDRCMSAVVTDMVPVVEAAWSVDDVLQAVPFGVSTPVLLYDRRAFTRAGLDPADPPATLDEVRDASRQLVDTGVTDAGLAVETGAESGGTWYVEQWAAQAGEPALLPANGRDGRAESVAWDDGPAAQWLTWLDGMVTSGLATSTGANGNGLDNIVAVTRPERPAAMTIHTSGALAEMAPLLHGGPGGAELGVAPLPGPGPHQRSLPGGTALWMAAGQADDETAATWQLAAYLASAPVNARWAAATGYAPLSAAATALEPLRTTWAERPELRVAYDVLAAQGTSAAELGPSAGPLADLHERLAGAVADVVDGDRDPAEALADAAADADDLLDAYNAGAPD
jgi:sn-glycerol 3-phosphate transport system substrate-binding protein